MAIHVRRAVIGTVVVLLVLGLTPYQAEQTPLSNPFLSKAPGSASAASATTWAPPRDIEPPKIRRSEYNLESAPLRTLVPVANRKTRGVAGKSLPQLQQSFKGVSGDSRALQQDPPLPFPDQNFNGVPNVKGRSGRASATRARPRAEATRSSSTTSSPNAG
jgi:hypothetical protein